jgi:transposase-like protein
VVTDLRLLWRSSSQGDEENQLQRYRYPPEIIHQAVWLYLRFILSFRDMEDLLAERGIAVTDETKVLRWRRIVLQGDLKVRRSSRGGCTTLRL